MQLCHFAVKIVVDNGKYTLESRPYFPHIASIEFDSNFSNDSSPGSTTITIHGLTRATAANFYNNAPVALFAGFYNQDYSENNVGYIMGGTITSLQPLFNDGGDWQLQFTIQDGAKYDQIATLKTKVSKNIRKKASLRGNPKLTKEHRNKIQEITNYYKRIRASKKHTRAEGKALTAKEQAEKRTANTQYKANVAKANAANAKLDTSKKKIEYKPISFKPKTKGKTIITTIAQKAGIKIQKLQLVKNKVFKKGYVAKQRPFKCIQEIAADCGTDVMYVHGGLSIAKFSKQHKLSYKATKETGLITPPQLQVDDNNDTVNATTNNSKTKKKKNKNKVNKISPTNEAANNQKNGTYQATLVFNSQITTGSIFVIKDPLTGFHGEIIVNSGEHSFSSGSTPTTQITFELLSKYEADQEKLAKAKTDEQAQQDAKDQLAKKKFKSARSNRTKSSLTRKAGGHGGSTSGLLHTATQRALSGHFK